MIFEGKHSDHHDDADKCMEFQNQLVLGMAVGARRVGESGV